MSAKIVSAMPRLVGFNYVKSSGALLGVEDGLGGLALPTRSSLPGRSLAEIDNRKMGKIKKKDRALSSMFFQVRHRPYRAVRNLSV